MTKWLYLVIASGLEVAWAIGLKCASSLAEWVVTLVCIVGSFLFLVMATKRLGASTSYVFFVTFGTIGTYILDTVWFGKPFSAVAAAAIAVVLFCIVQIKREVKE
ncbi:hypothetical protein JAK44_01470 [Stenotrophomonas maltophilia]|uniref:DMT family transporter n=1 Tax=Stenotrophomonas TaxID=40323 RepID=UPI0021CA99AF|nr:MULTISPECIES: SMR family transporter [Stenotrophomonas]MCU0999636.1 hypothetical protein [Stenotrophomonas maltophilia]